MEKPESCGSSTKTKSTNSISCSKSSGESPGRNQVQSKLILWLFATVPLLGSPVKIEQRGDSVWPTGNNLRFRLPDSTPKGRPVWVDTELPAKFNPDSLRVLADAAIIAIPAKV